MVSIVSSPSVWFDGAAADLDDDVILVSPHIVTGFARFIAEAAAGSPRTWAVVTTIDPTAAARGDLSVDGLRMLLDAEVQIQHVDRLRTHCFFVGRRALLGTANLGTTDENSRYLDREDETSDEDAAGGPMELAVELTGDQLAEAWARIARRRSVVVNARDLDWLRAQLR
ncbi:hypothetical protein KACC15558_09020 [Brevibacterium ammoniilyticum]|uniref:Phospholipase D-like domain-containing protein n=1 Tax=Brevibacterium ammoniilyticum TaxID=1046555 RepID=A0ABP9TYD2_9MICO